jgi:cold shock CspA family protein
MRGRIKTMTTKGFGFVREEATSTDYFLHRDTNPELFDEALVGDIVDFDGYESPKGLRVTAIERV